MGGVLSAYLFSVYVNDLIVQLVMAFMLVILFVGCALYADERSLERN